MSEGALFSGRASVDLDASARRSQTGTPYLEDKLQTSYDEAVRRSADWYRSSLSEPEAEPDDNGAHEPDAPAWRSWTRPRRSRRLRPPLRQADARCTPGLALGTEPPRTEADPRYKKNRPRKGPVLYRSSQNGAYFVDRPSRRLVLQTDVDPIVQGNLRGNGPVLAWLAMGLLRVGPGGGGGRGSRVLPVPRCSCAGS